MNAIFKTPERADACELVIDPERPWLELRVGAHAKVPRITVHPGLPPPTRALVQIGRGSDIAGEIMLWGESPSVIIGEFTQFIAGVDACCGGTASIEIGSRCAVGLGTMFNARHDGRIVVGDDCMISNRVSLYTDDMHAIRDIASGERINKRGATTIIDRHVWLGLETIIMPGASIGEDSVLGARSVASGVLPPQALCVGTPAKPVRHGITWSQEDLP